MFDHGFVEVALADVDFLRKVQVICQEGQEHEPEICLALSILRRRSSLAPHSALIVDGSDVVSGMLRDILNTNHFRIEVLNDGYAALGRIWAAPFDVIITRLEIERLNGIAFISAVKRAGSRIAKMKTILLASTQTQLKFGPDKPDFILKKDTDLGIKLKQAIESISLN